MLEKPIGNFCVYYGDGSTYSHKHGSPYYAPAVDVQCIVIPHPDYPKESGTRTVLFGKTLKAYYCMHPDGSWYITDDAGYYDYMMNVPGPKKVLFGRTMAKTLEFYKLINDARKKGYN